MLLRLCSQHYFILVMNPVTFYNNNNNNNNKNKVQFYMGIHTFSMKSGLRTNSKMRQIVRVFFWQRQNIGKTLI